MQYEGQQTRPLIAMLVHVYAALTELGMEPVWNEHGVTVSLAVPLNDGTWLSIWRQYAAEPGRLVETAVLHDLPVAGSPLADAARELASLNTLDAPRVAVDADGHLTCSTMTDSIAADVTPLFMGRLLDGSTRALLDAANALSMLPPRMP